MKYAVITCVSENWLAPACVTLLSVSRNLEGVKADLHIIVDTLSEESRDNVFSFAQKHNIKINLEIHNPVGFSTLDTRRYSNASLLRLCLPEIMPQNYERVLYLDSDVLAMGDLSQLLQCDLHGKFFGAVPEVKMAHRRGILTDWHRTQIGIPPSSDYFNSGVLLFDWPKTSEAGLLEKARALLLGGKRFQHPDQDVLNLVAINQWQALPIKYNVDQSAQSYLGVKPKLRHFNHGAKPWDWPQIMDYARYHDYYVQALRNLELSRFLHQPKRGNPWQATAEFYFRRMSFHQCIKLRKRYAHLL